MYPKFNGEIFKNINTCTQTFNSRRSNAYKVSGIADTTDETKQGRNAFRYPEQEISMQSNSTNPSEGHNTHVCMEDGRALEREMTTRKWPTHQPSASLFPLTTPDHCNS